MGHIVLIEEKFIASPPAVVFGLFGRVPAAGWLFGAECDAVRAGAAVRFRLPIDIDGGLLQTVGRLVEVEAGRRLVIAHENPWHGRVTCTLRPEGGGSLVRVVVEVVEHDLAWMLRRRGLDVADNEPDPWAVPIGLLISQSGPASVFAAASENLARMAVDEINAEGGVAGRPLHLIVADDATDPCTGAAQARRLIDHNRCAVLITNVTSATFEAVRPIAERAGALLIYTPVNEGGRGGSRLFRWGERPAGQLKASIPRLMRETGARHWYLAGNDYSWPRSTCEQAQRVIERRGGVVVRKRYEPLGSQGFRPLLEDIERSGAELIVSTFVGADEALFERQFHAAGLRSRCRTIALALDESTREHAGDEATAGVWTAFSYFQHLSTAANQAFVNRYRRRFGQYSPPLSSISESVYEAVHLYTRAAQCSPDRDPSVVASALRQQTFDGPRGRVTVDGPARLRQPVYLAESVAGGFRVLDAIA